MVWCLVALMMTHLLRSVKEFFAQTTPEKKKYSEMHRPKIVYMEDIYPKSKSSEKKDNIQTKTPLKKTEKKRTQNIITVRPTPFRLVSPINFSKLPPPPHTHTHIYTQPDAKDEKKKRNRKKRTRNM